MKVILNEDVKYLGEEGDIKVVANGYARNYLLPRALVVPYNEATAAVFEAKKAEIEARKEVKRQNARSLKDKIEENPFEIEMPAGSNGKLYGAVTPVILVEALAKAGFEIEKKRIDMGGLTIKSVGTYHAVVKLYENQTAEMTFNVKAHITEAPKTEEKARKPRRQETKESQEAQDQVEDSPAGDNDQNE